MGRSIWELFLPVKGYLVAVLGASARSSDTDEMSGMAEINEITSLPMTHGPGLSSGLFDKLFLLIFLQRIILPANLAQVVTI